MPNWVYNIVTPINDVAKEFIKEWCLDDKNNFTFNKLIPMPEIFEYTSAPIHPVTEEEFTKYLETHKDNKNLVKDHIQDGIAYIRHEGVTLNTYAITTIGMEKLKRMFKYADWWEFRVNEWGCKWDADNCYDKEDSRYRFDTPWCSPYKFIEKMVKSCPTMELTWDWQEEQGFGESYRIVNGEVIITQSWDEPDVNTITLNLKFDDDSTLERDLTVIHKKETPFNEESDEWLGYMYDAFNHPLEALCDNGRDKHNTIIEIDRLSELANYIYGEYIYPNDLNIDEYLDSINNLPISKELLDNLKKEYTLREVVNGKN